ncbi:ATP-dependent helicase [Ureibacillus massiliensis 4400831 = CIP 108448 = CCUG 49529]|uniref:ATP-dependent helicase n=2 Tax=cellular organisms TaxID=131567 RepID=A0A0A3J2A0_9BACL|nr:SNF2-related protein [Ureibacillus massiliensis]KGR89815.1 ATP-dependent helicase [Ureibacillus massiliensis 4400831 = CIP 108448 = CCUG 49529]
MIIERLSNWREDFNKRFEEDGPWDSWTLYKMTYEIEKMNLIPEFSGLQAPKFLTNLQLLPHQVEAAQTVIEKMNGKAILADEVGLGKTIEAGLIMKEYMIRGLVKKTLILVPASLQNQWVTELNVRFFIPAIPYKKNTPLDQYDVVVMSMDTAKKSPHREKIYEQDYDMIIIDEAHKLKNHKTQVYQFVQSLKKKFCLLLTATPIQNDVFEIFYLVSLLKPGHLGNLETFQSSFSATKHGLEQEKFLKELVNQVMVRNRRQDTGIEWTTRKVKTVPVQFTEDERKVYDKIVELKNVSSIFTSSFTMVTLLKEMCSSKEATFLTLNKMKEKCITKEEIDYIEEIIEMLMNLEVNSKAEQVLEIIKEANDKVIIFTEYRATQAYLQWYLNTKGISSVLFNGKFSKSKRDWVKQLFRERDQVLIATESGGEGINLQFCHHVINYDLPWNPMKLEQRIGRVHRLGQEEDVHIYNLAIEDTIEQKILDLLGDKIDVFEKVVGDLDDILTKKA